LLEISDLCICGFFNEIHVVFQLDVWSHVVFALGASRQVKQFTIYIVNVEEGLSVFELGRNLVDAAGVALPP